ncbi:uncharacterized protein JCM10292_006317 [Rhodotorula paludigena]|uniref:uncharacterized protein n=1 Tax=Rhodotorula paludigena TaxID=86838 RepID=UPI00317F53F2
MLRSSCLPSLAAAPLALLRSSYATTATTVHPLVATLRGALKQSMLARTTERTSVIKSILADIQTAQHAAGNAPTPLKSLATAISRRVDAAQTFRSSTPPRADLAEQYEREAAILREFVPQKSADALSKEQIEKLVKEVLVANELKKAVGKDTGRIIALVREQTGDRAEAKDIAAAVKSIELP